MADQKRRLAAILSADVAGYSRLMQDDEAATVETLTKYREIFQDLVTRHDGRIVDNPGDNVLAEFASPVEAVQSAIDIQRELGFRNRQLADHRQMHFRIGVNLGDVIGRDDGTLYGDGVNVAARLETLAEPGGIIISEDAHRHVEGKLEIAFADFGEHEVKNITKPVHAYRVTEPEQLDQVVAKPKRAFPTSVLATAAVLVVISVGIVIWAAIDHSRTNPVRRQSNAIAQTQNPVLAMPTGPSIAVLPFDNLSGDAAQDYFSDGITEDIITQLSRFSDLRVISRKSAFQYKGLAVDIRKIAKDLGADYILEGSIRRSGQDLRIVSQLIDSVDGTHIWAETFDRQFDTASLFDVQDTITEAVVSEIAGQHGVIARKLILEGDSIRPESMGSYECMLLAYAYGRDYSPESHDRAKTCLEEAIKSEPSYADAYAALSMLYVDQFAHRIFSSDSDFDPLDRAFDMATRAVEIQPTNSNAHRHLAMVYFHRHDIGSFRKHANRAIELNPNDPTTLGYLGIYLTWSGDMSGIPLVRKATTLNPELPLWFYQVFAWEHYSKGEYTKGLDIIEKNSGGAFYWDDIWRLFFLGHLGRHDEARSVYKRLDEAYPNFSIIDYRRECTHWNVPEDMVEMLADGLRASGVPEGVPTN